MLTLKKLGLVNVPCKGCFIYNNCKSQFHLYVSTMFMDTTQTVTSHSIRLFLDSIIDFHHNAEKTLYRHRKTFRLKLHLCVNTAKMIWAQNMSYMGKRPSY